MSKLGLIREHHEKNSIFNRIVAFGGDAVNGTTGTENNHFVKAIETGGMPTDGPGVVLLFESEHYGQWRREIGFHKGDCYTRDLPEWGRFGVGVKGDFSE